MKKDVGVSIFAYPVYGLSHALSVDKQLESAHAGGYYT